MKLKIEIMIKDGFVRETWDYSFGLRNAGVVFTQCLFYLLYSKNLTLVDPPFENKTIDFKCVY